MKLKTMPLDPLMSLPTLLLSEDSFLEKSRQGVQLTPNTIGMNAILAEVLRKMENIIHDRLIEDCAFVNLPTSTGIARERGTKFDNPSSDEIALRFLTDVVGMSSRSKTIFYFSTQPVTPFHDGFIVSNESKVMTAYSVCATEYDKHEVEKCMQQHFLNIFRLLGVPVLIVKNPKDTCDEYMVLNPTGDKAVLYNPDIQIAINPDKYTYQDNASDNEASILQSSIGKFEERRATKVGEISHIGRLPLKKDLIRRNSKTEESHYLLTRYSIDFNSVLNCIIKNCYGEHGLIWPDSITPFEYHIVCMADFKNEAQRIYDTLRKNGINVLYDDRIWINYDEQNTFAKYLGIPKLILVDGSDFDNPQFKTRDTVKVFDRRSEQDKWITLKQIIETHNRH